MFAFPRANVVPHYIVSRTHLPRPDVPANDLFFLPIGFGVPTRAQSVKRSAANESFKNLKYPAGPVRACPVLSVKSSNVAL